VEIRVGTSGFSYKEWKGSFYPEKMRPEDMLRHYAERLTTVEINNTFYRMPKAELLLGWAAQVPEDFVFVLKGSQRITHMKRLKDAGEAVGYLFEAADHLGSRLGPVFFQLPPHFKKDVARLEDFLQVLPRERPVAFEFRHESWFDEEVYSALRGAGAALCAADTDESGEEGAPVVPTGRFGYLRLRRAEYSDRDLSGWADKVRAQAWDRAFVFFKHEDAGKGPAMAARFRAIVEGQLSASRPG
jgi:uncharacterized protein YecE (DUF72 family)